MADARKRAKAKQEAAEAAVPPVAEAGAELPAEPVARPVPAPPPEPAAAEPAPEAPAELVFPAEEPAPVETAWVAREEALVFPAGPAPAVPARLTLPASGLADDILRELEQRPQAAAVAAPAAAAPADEGASQSFAFFAPQREEKKAVEAQEHLATFFLAGEEYGIDVRLVQEIIRVAEITQVPRAPSHIRGVINLRGRIIPVVDLRRKLELGTVEATRQARIVVVKLRDRLVGLLVDGASQVLKVPLSLVEPPPEEVVEVHQNAIRGVAKLQDRLIILLDLTKALSGELRDAAAAEERVSS
jgi:purine-binding chemotaxis protein CheW